MRSDGGINNNVDHDGGDDDNGDLKYLFVNLLYETKVKHVQLIWSFFL